MSSAQSLLRVADELKALEAVNPNKAFDQLEDLVETRSIQELSSILNTVYAGVAEDLGIDWNFTATQWKLGNNDVAEFFGISPEARFKVWSLPLNRSVVVTQTRFTTYLPFPLLTDHPHPQKITRPVAVSSNRL